MYYPHGASPYGFSTTTLFGGDCSSAARELQKCVKNPFGREKKASASQPKPKKRITPTLVSAPPAKSKKKGLISDHDPIRRKKPTIADDYKKIIADLKRPSAIGFTGQQTEKEINEKLLEKIQDPNYGKDSYKDLVIKAKKKKAKKKDKEKKK